jgi:hypothetical protein
VKPLAAVALVVAAAALFWNYHGYKIWNEYLILRQEVRTSEDAAPVGYVGLNYRRSYNDRPLAFQTREGGKALLFAAKRPDGSVEHYDVTEADPALDVNCLGGGFGRDSIPGIDYPVVETPGHLNSHALRDRQPVFGVTLGGAVRAYPKDLLEKIEVVNDRLGDTAVVVVYDRGVGAPLVYERSVRGGAVTFGTTGYACRKRPLLYDRKTKSLWMSDGATLACLNGPRKGEAIKPVATPAATPWAAWWRQNPATTVVVGNDRSRPIPEE